MIYIIIHHHTSQQWIVTGLYPTSVGSTTHHPPEPTLGAIKNHPKVGVADPCGERGTQISPDHVCVPHYLRYIQAHVICYTFVYGSSDTRPQRQLDFLLLEPETHAMDKSWRSRKEHGDHEPKTAKNSNSGVTSMNQAGCFKFYPWVMICHSMPCWWCSYALCLMLTG